MSTTTSSGSAAAKPSSAGSGPVKELTIRGVLIGGVITLVFTAANVYLGLKVGLTFATSIPAAVISMAVLRRFSDHTIQENNIVQTIASAAGTLSAIIFVLPGLIIVGWWTGFPYLQTVLVIILGGILGVTYSIPLRRALVTSSDLPYPEGVAGAEVLRVGDTSEGSEESSRGLGVIVRGSIASAALYFLKAISVDISGVFRVGAGATMVGTSLSLALIGVGHLVGVGVGIAMIVGLLISYGVLLPMRTWGGAAAAKDLADFVSTTFASEVRIAGAGAIAIAIAAIWTFVKILGPIATGIRESLASSAKRDAGEEIPLTERDLSMKTVIGVTVGSMLPIGVLLWLFLHGTSMAHHTAGLIIASILFILLTGLVVASVCGYMAGLIGSSNSPISGVGILVAVTAAALVRTIATTSSPDDVRTLVAYTLFVTAVVFGVATISNDNLQDLKTGQLVDSTPWKQQVALVIGVVFGAIVIPPVLSLMQGAFGFAGAPGAGADALAAPQANLIKHLVQGVLGGDLNWSLLGLGALIGAVVIAIDEILRRNSKYSLPPLAVGMGMYLPMAVTVMIPIGAALGHVYDRWAQRTANPERAKRMGTLMATGLIVGESLAGVVYAGIVVAFGGKEDALAIMPEGFAGIAPWVGLVLFVGTLWYLYRGARQESTRD
ncbi:OPT family oligopeptide transporter [Actinomyces oris]|uniref:Oligopeptide transporter, OPT family n=1 Tax=Actinomyces oris TaxID=544580 RepID=A0A1Q8VCQ2_9ACTO|nr:oligopeptide transporter, OPT family [Actinomyces oris]OLO45864.1 oligopeptide transporter, OPT family [Actinomyces oris]